jgi:5'-nucleotidase
MIRSFSKVLLFAVILIYPFFTQCASDKKDTDSSHKSPVTLTLLHFNDGESKLLHAGKGVEEFGGIARLVSIIKRKRDEVDYSQNSHVHITVSSGDNFLSGPVFNASLRKGVPYYDAIAIDLLPVDAITLGNHDFDYGPDVLADFIKSFHRSSPAFLSSNLDFSDEPVLQKMVETGNIVKSTVIKRNRYTFGLIGLTSPDLAVISSPRKVKVNRDIVACVQQEVRSLEAKGINKIILISHLQGIGKEIELISKLHSIDIVVAGGGDELLANTETTLISHEIKNKEIIDEKIFGPYPLYVEDAKKVSVPIVTTCGEYRYVGLLQVSFNAEGEIVKVHENSGPIRVVGEKYIDGVNSDSAIVEQVNVPLTHALESINNHIIGISQINLGGNRTSVRSRETQLGNLLSDALLWAAQLECDSYKTQRPTIAMINGGSIRMGLVAGDISELDIFNVCPFSTLITIVEDVSPREFKDILENAYSRVRADGSIEGESGTGRFAQIAGFNVIYNSAKKPGNRVKQVVLNNNKPIVSDYRIVNNAPSVHLATIGFLARGGDEWVVGKGRKINIGKTHRQALIDYIKEPVETGGMGGVINTKTLQPSIKKRIVRIDE